MKTTRRTVSIRPIVEYATGSVALKPDEGPAIGLLNLGRRRARARVIVWWLKPSGGSSGVPDEKWVFKPAIAWDSGWLFAEPGQPIYKNYVADDDRWGDHWVRIECDSDSVVPWVRFLEPDEIDPVRPYALDDDSPIVDYHPGDFAVFRGSRRQLRRAA